MIKMKKQCPECNSSKIENDKDVPAYYICENGHRFIFPKVK